MKVTDQHIDFIENSLKLYGVKDKALKEDLLDHICTYLENEDSEDFDNSYQKALQKFGGYGSFKNLQLEANLQKIANKAIILNTLFFGVGCIVILLFVLSFLFKIMHWPYANIMMVAGLLIATLILVPIYFYNKYKKSILNFS